MSMPIDILISSDATEIDGGGDPTNVDTDWSVSTDGGLTGGGWIGEKPVVRLKLKPL